LTSKPLGSIFQIVKKLLGLYNVKKLVDEGHSREDISKAIFNDLQKQLKNATFPLARAIEIAKSAHLGQFDKAGKPYIDHPFNVMNQLRGNLAKMTGVLHDVVEDTNTTFEDLEKMGCPSVVIEALKLVTHPKNYRGTKAEYINGIKAIADSGNQLAIDVKYADLTHNSDTSRLSNPTKKDLARTEKYKKCLDILRPLVSDYLKI
jgi:GTP diphosphokinase / guanosine-3',5'-bis(diphosphate) 3'-diphosphatase